MTSNKHLLLFLPLLCLLGCLDDEEPMDVNEEEVITEVEWVLTPDDSQLATVTCLFSDPDGDGGNPPTVTVTGDLVAGAGYRGSLGLANPTEDIGAEVAEEDEDHQVFYLTNNAGLAISYADADDNGRPLGLLTDVTAAAAGTATVTIILRHEPDKEAAGLTIDQPELAGGETDIEIDFSLVINQ